MISDGNCSDGSRGWTDNGKENAHEEDGVDRDRKHGTSPSRADPGQTSTRAEDGCGLFFAPVPGGVWKVRHYALYGQRDVLARERGEGGFVGDREMSGYERGAGFPDHWAAVVRCWVTDRTFSIRIPRPLGARHAWAFST